MFGGTGKEPTTRAGADDDDGRDVEDRVVPCSVSVVSVPPSRKPSSSAMVGGGTARSSLNFELFL